MKKEGESEKESQGKVEKRLRSDVVSKAACRRSCDSALYLDMRPSVGGIYKLDNSISLQFIWFDFEDLKLRGNYRKLVSFFHLYR